MKTVRATQYMRTMITGRTKPCLMRCEGNDGEQCDVVVKLRGSADLPPSGSICEGIASMMAEDLDLPVPTPYIVEIDPDLFKAILNPNVAEVFKRSAGENFGSAFIGTGFSTWLVGRSLSSSLVPMAADVFAFDVLIQNPDRRRDKPNLLSNGDDLAIFDHEMAFSFLYALRTENPWEGQGLGFVEKHVFYQELKQRKLSWDRMIGALEAVDDGRLREYGESIPAAWQAGNEYLERILEYIGKARQNSTALFQTIGEVLQ